jgi:hypothetical protein
VLSVAASGATVEEARELAYRAVDAIHFPTGFHRRDIGWREIKREKAAKPARCVVLRASTVSKDTPAKADA